MDQYDLSSFDKLRWPVHTIGIGEKIAFPEMSKYPEFKAKISGIDKSKLIRYIVYCYDINSPLFNDLDKILERKVAAARLAEFEQDDDLNFSDKVQELFANKIKEANAMIIRYARLQNALDFSLLVAGLDHFYTLLYMLESHTEIKDILVDGKKKNALFKECRVQLNELKDIAKTVFGESGLLDDLDTITQEADPTLIRGSFVEARAKKKK